MGLVILTESNPDLLQSMKPKTIASDQSGLTSEDAPESVDLTSEAKLRSEQGLPALYQSLLAAPEAPEVHKSFLVQLAWDGPAFPEWMER